MAFVNLSISYDLASVDAVVRSQTGTISVQESKLFKNQMASIVHYAITWVRMIAGARLDDDYSTTVKSINSEITESSGLIDISALSIMDIKRMSLFDSLHGEVAFKSDAEFFREKTLYQIGTTNAANALFCRVSNIKVGTDNKRVIEVQRGSNKAKGDLVLSYYRNPKKVTTPTEELDLPDSYMPIAIDVATKLVLGRIGKTVPADVAARIAEFVQTQTTRS